MKTLLLIATFTLTSITSMAEYRPGRVLPKACGYNMAKPVQNGAIHGGRVSQVCMVAIQGMSIPTPLYSFDIVSHPARTVTHIYAQVDTGVINYGLPQQRIKAPSTINLQIIGTVENGTFNRLYFVRAPEILTFNATFDRQLNVVGIAGYLSSILPVQVPQFAPVFTTQSVR